MSWQHHPGRSARCLEAVLDSPELVWGDVKTKADGPAGALPLTDEMLRHWPSGDLFSLSQNAGMGWEVHAVARDPFLILSTQGGLRAPDGTPIALGYRNAMCVHAAFGGSTNLLLHIPALAFTAGLRRPTVDDWHAVNLEVPRLVSVLPNGPYYHPTVRALAGGVPEVMLHLRALGLLDLSVLTVTGEPLARTLDWWEASDRRQRLRERLFEEDHVDPDVVIMSPARAREQELTSTVTFPRGNLAPEGSVIKSTAIDPSVVDAERVWIGSGFSRPRRPRSPPAALARSRAARRYPPPGGLAGSRRRHLGRLRLPHQRHHRGAAGPRLSRPCRPPRLFPPPARVPFCSLNHRLGSRSATAIWATAWPSMIRSTSSFFLRTVSEE